MNFRLSGIGLILASNFGGAAWYVMGAKFELLPIVGAIFVYFCMAALFSLFLKQPRIGIASVLLAFLPAVLVGNMLSSVAVGLYFFSCMATAYAYSFKE